MDYANVSSYAATAMAGVIIGNWLGRKMSSNVLGAIERRLAVAEAKFADHNGSVTGASACAGSIDKYAVAAAVEINAGLVPVLNGAIAKPTLA